MNKPASPSEEALTRLRRGLRCEAIAVPGEGLEGVGAAGRWRINAGSPMIQWLGEIDRRDPVVVIVDLSTALAARTELQANYMHWGWDVIGRWRNLNFESSGDIGIYADLMLYTVDDKDADTTKERLSSASYVRDLLRRDHPFEVSIEGDFNETVQYDIVAPGESVTVNGQTYAANDFEYQLVIARNLTVKGAGVVDYGADPETMRIAASMLRGKPEHPTEQESIMKPKERLVALKAKHPQQFHGLIAEAVVDEKTDEEIEAAISAEEKKQLEETIEAQKAENEMLKATVAELEEKLEAKAEGEGNGETKDEKKPVEAQGKPAIQGSKRTVQTLSGDDGAGGKPNGPTPKTMHDAMKVLAREASENGKEAPKGIAARNTAFKRWPDLKPDHMK